MRRQSESKRSLEVAGLIPTASYILPVWVLSGPSHPERHAVEQAKRGALMNVSVKAILPC